MVADGARREDATTERAETPPPLRICFVCLGNICRSPMAEAVMRRRLEQAGLSDRVHVASAGTGDWHVGHDADRRALLTLRGAGYDLEHAARQFARRMFDSYDLVIALDHSNMADLQALAPDDAARAKLHLLRSFDPMATADDLAVPDPYYGGDDGFPQVLAMIEAACEGLLAELREGAAA